MTWTVEALARHFGLPWEGDGRAVIERTASLKEAGEGDITFLASPRYAELAAKAAASAIVVKPDFKGPCAARALIRAPDPDAAFVPIAVLLAPPSPPAPAAGVDPMARVAGDAVFGANVSIGPFAVVESGVRIGENTRIGAFCYLGYRSTVGRDSLLYPHVCIREYCTVGDRAILHPGVVIGSDGFGFYPDRQGHWQKIPQVGRVEIGHDVEIGANTCVDRARFGVTRIEDGVKLDNLVQVAHNVVIGAHTVVAGCTGIAGSVVIGRHVRIGGKVGIRDHLTIGDGATIGGGAHLFRDVPPGQFYSGSPAIPHQQYMRKEVELSRLYELRARIRELEQKINALEEGGEGTARA